MDDLLDLTPPLPGPPMRVTDAPKYKMVTKNTGITFWLDKEDFNKAKHTHWYETRKGLIVTLTNTSIEEYVGLVRTGRKTPSPLHDYRRMWYA